MLTNEQNCDKIHQSDYSGRTCKMALREPTTAVIRMGEGATAEAISFIGSRRACAVCDTNTQKFAEEYFPALPRFVFPDGWKATDVNAAHLIDQIKSDGIELLVAVGTGTIHDLTRYSAFHAGVDFISYPTAPSMDGFVSSIAAMTINGQKITYPAKPPVALFAEPAVYQTSPMRLTLAGMGDILGKYISVFDWKVAEAVAGEKVDEDLVKLETDAIDKMLSIDPVSPDFHTAVLEGLVMTGMTIQYFGSSRPASGAEHHLSHIWEMHVINEDVEALHGEKVGVSTLILLRLYKSLLDKHIIFRPKDNNVEYLRTAYGDMAEGIAAENTPDPLANITQEKLDAAAPRIRQLIRELPDPDKLEAFMKSIGAKTEIAQLGLPADSEFLAKTLEFAPYVRRRITLLKLL